jgi:hypothetical protein
VLSTKKREKKGLSRERGINGHVRKRLAGLCRESPFTALASEATFAVQMIGFTIHQVRRKSIGEAGHGQL